MLISYKIVKKQFIKIGKIFKLGHINTNTSITNVPRGTNIYQYVVNVLN